MEGGRLADSRRTVPSGLREQWARSWRIVGWAGFFAAVGGNIVPAALRVTQWRETEWTIFGVFVSVYVISDQMIAWARRQESRRRAQRGLPPGRIPVGWPWFTGHGVTKRGFWNIVTFVGGALIFEGIAHMVMERLEYTVFSSFAPAAAVTWFWLRGAEKHPPKAAQYGAVSGLAAGVVMGYLAALTLIGLSKETQGHFEILWAHVLALGARWGLLGLAGGIVIDRGLELKFVLALPVSLLAAGAASHLLQRALMIPVNALDFFFVLLLGAGWGWGVLAGRQSQDEATRRTLKPQPAAATPSS